MQGFLGATGFRNTSYESKKALWLLCEITDNK